MKNNEMTIILKHKCGVDITKIAPVVSLVKSDLIIHNDKFFLWYKGHKPDGKTRIFIEIEPPLILR